MPKVGMQPVRHQQLIDATFKVIEDSGLSDVTLSSVATEAGLSAGIVSHYFGNKDGLLEAAMRQILRDLREAVLFHCIHARDQTPRTQLRAIVHGNFAPSQTSPTAMRSWLAFWSASLNNPQFKRLQRANDRRLHSNLAYQFGREMDRKSARNAATGLAALIDGLWLRGTLAGGQFDTEQALSLAFDFIDQHLPSPDRGPSANLTRRKKS